MDPEQLAAAVAVADESLAAQTTDYRLQAAIAQDRLTPALDAGIGINLRNDFNHTVRLVSI